MRWQLKKNLNRASVIRDEQLAKLASSIPKPNSVPDVLGGTWAALDNLELAEELVEVYEKALKKPKSQWPEVDPNPKPMPANQQRQYDFLKLFLAALGDELGIPARVFGGKSDLEAYVRSEFTMESGEFFQSWRKDVVGKAVKQALSGELSIGFSADKYFLTGGKEK